MQETIGKAEALCKDASQKTEIKPEVDTLAKVLLSLKECKEYLDNIESSCNQQKVLVDDALDFSKVESDNIQLNPEPFHLQRTYNNLLNMYKPQLEKKNIKLNVSYPKHVIGLKADSFRLSQVVSNLISNAIKFTPQDGNITVMFEYDIISETECRLIVKVEDNGIGMSPEELAGLFQPFTQAHSAITSQYGGSGLGLVICKKLVEKMGGQMDVQSQKGKGTAFCFSILGQRLNAQEVASLTEQSAGLLESQPRPTPASPISGEGKSILVVDDAETNRHILCNYLKSGGYFYVTAENGADAIEKCRNHRFDAILMDIEMPVMNGSIATQTLREQGVTTPIIGLSGYADPDQVNALMQQGFSNYLTKPVRKEELLTTLEDYTKDATTKHVSPTEEHPRLSTYGDFRLFKPRSSTSPKPRLNLSAENIHLKDYLKDMVNRSTYYMTMIDPNYNVIMMNEAAQQEFFNLFGKKCKAGSNILELMQDDPEKLSKIKTLWDPALVGEQSTLFEKFTDLKGHEHLYEVNIAPIKNENGSIVGASHLAQRARIEKLMEISSEIISENTL